MSARRLAIALLPGLLTLLVSGPTWAQSSGAGEASSGAGEPAPGRILQDATLSPVEGGGVVLSLAGDGALSHRVFVLEGPHRVVLDLPGVGAPIPVRLADESGFVQKVRCAPRRDPRGRPLVRYVVETRQAASYRVETQDAGLRLRVAPPTPGAPSAGPATVTPDEGPAAAPSPPVPAAVAPPEVAAPAPAAALLAAVGMNEPLPEAGPPPLAEGGSGEPAPMSLDVQGADVRTVFRSIAEYAGVNIVADSNVSGAVTIRATDLPWWDMLRAVAQAAGLVVVEAGPVIRVATQRTSQEEALALESTARKQEEFLPLETRVVPVRYANAGELQETLAKIASGRGQVQVDGRTNALIVTDIAPRLAQIEDMVRQLDTETVQVEIAAQIIDVDASVARQLGISWSGTGLQSPGARASGSIALTPGEVLDPAADVQVGFLRSFGEIESRLRALEQERKAEIVSAPRITTADNRMARILVGKQVPLITQDFAGNAITELKKVGIALEVTPHVNANDEITMDLHPEISDLAAAATSQGGIVFTTTEADTRVLVADGATAVIGGLFRKGELVTERGVPLLKDVPVLGHLFKTSDRQAEKRELLILVTPRIVRGGKASAEQVTGRG